MSEFRPVLGKPMETDIRYPLTYRITTGSRVAAVLLCLFFGGSGIGLGVFLSTHWNANLLADGFLALIAALLVLGAAWGLLYAFTATLTIQADRLELHKVFGTRVIARNDILGGRYNRGRGGLYPVIVLRSGKSYVLQPNDFGFDERFSAWFRTLPDLEALERAATLAAIENDPSLGADSRQRLAALATAKQFGVAINAMAMAASAWLLVFPRPYAWAIVAAIVLPWLATLCVWLRPNLFQFDGKTGDIKPNVFLALAVPPVALAVRALFDVTMVDLANLFLWGPIVGLPLLLAAALVPRPAGVVAASRMTLVVLASVVAIIYGTSSLALVDTAFDQAPPGVYPTHIVDKHRVRGKQTSYYVYVAAWNSGIEANKFRVSSSYYYNTNKGDAVCVDLHPGTFGLRWLQLDRCR